MHSKSNQVIQLLHIHNEYMAIRITVIHNKGTLKKRFSIKTKKCYDLNGILQLNP